MNYVNDGKCLGKHPSVNSLFKNQGFNSRAQRKFPIRALLACLHSRIASHQRCNVFRSFHRKTRHRQWDPKAPESFSSIARLYAIGFPSPYSQLRHGQMGKEYTDDHFFSTQHRDDLLMNRYEYDVIFQHFILFGAAIAMTQIPVQVPQLCPGHQGAQGGTQHHHVDLLMIFLWNKNMDKLFCKFGLFWEDMFVQLYFSRTSLELDCSEPIPSKRNIYVVFWVFLENRLDGLRKHWE